MQCLNCEKELVQIPQKRGKQFCNSTCRSNYWQKKKRKLEKVNIKDLTVASNVINPFEHPKTNYTIDTTKKQHPKFKETDPREGSNGFFLKYGVFTYNEL